MNREEVKIGPKGRVDLPLWLCAALLKRSGVRSKKFRIQKKAIKREFIKLLRAAADRKNKPT
jgi:hypothetical protein